MSLQINPSTSIERKLLFIETLLNSTDKVTKVSDDGILSGVAGGVSKVAGKAEKDIILAVSQLFPDTASGDQLNQVAANFGISPRFGALGSSSYVRVSATPGTTYFANTHVFKSASGITFNLAASFTVGLFGFAYAKVQSVETGVQANVDSLTITQVAPQPNGHLSVINEYKAEGGRDMESDEILRIRIKDGANILARGTIAMLEQRFISINTKVLKIYNQGHDLNGKIVIAIVTQNGADLSQSELDQLLDESADYLNLNEYRPFGTTFSGITLINAVPGYVDISFRVELDSAYDPDEIRKKIQINISKYIDPRFFDSSKQKVEWDNLLEICKNVPGVKYIPDQYFYPRSDIHFGPNKNPRMRGFLMLDLNGAIISNFQGTLSPSFYPAQADFKFVSTVLNII
jgi:hypothetical protein